MFLGMSVSESGGDVVVGRIIVTSVALFIGFMVFFQFITLLVNIFFGSFSLPSDLPPDMYGNPSPFNDLYHVLRGLSDFGKQILLSSISVVIFLIISFVKSALEGEWR